MFQPITLWPPIPIIGFELVQISNISPHEWLTSVRLFFGTRLRAAVSNEVLYQTIMTLTTFKL